MNTVVNKTIEDKFKAWLPSLLYGELGRQYYIGLDIGFDRLNLVQMQSKADGVQLRAIASIPFKSNREALLSNPKELKLLLNQAFATHPFKGRKVVSCLPAEHIKIITIAYKTLDGQTEDEAVIVELRERYKNELDNLVVDFMSLRQEESDASKRDALVALAPRDKVLAYLDLLTGAGLSVEALDIGPAALTRLVCHTGAKLVPDFPNLPNVLLINFGTESSFLTIIWGRRLMLDRPVEFSEHRIFSRLQQVLDMPENLMISLLYDENTTAKNNQSYSLEVKKMVTDILAPEINLLLQEINKTLVYIASKTRGKSIDQIYLTGRVSRYSGIVQLLREQLNVKVEILDPVEIFTPDKSKVNNVHLGTMPGMALTTGLALRELPERG